MTTAVLPAFGEADLSNCEREPIHLAGSIQPHGALLVLDETMSMIVQASANAEGILNLGFDPVARAFTECPGTLPGRVLAQLDEVLDRRAVAVRGQIGEPAVPVEALVHREPGGGIVVECESVGPALDLHAAMIDTGRTMEAGSLRQLADAVTALVAKFTGYDRVMVYRFDELGHGEVCAERREGALEPFLGNRYPASDIPQIARRLYLETRVRLLVDVAYEPVPLVPRHNPLTGQDLDMSRCGLRSMSSIHLQYLKNMGVEATLVISLVIGGELWGLIACHHYAPKFIPFETRAFLEIVAEQVATRIAALDCISQSRSEVLVRRLEARMVEATGHDGDWRNALFDGSAPLLESLGAGGAALVYEGQVRCAGNVPGTQAIRDIATWLDRRHQDRPEPRSLGRPGSIVIHTAALGREAPDFAPLIDVAAGIVASPVSTNPGEWLIWFRPERVRTVTWGGDPTKPVIVGNDPRQLSPRLSFAQWFEVVEGTSDPWTKPALATARMIGGIVADMALQFRSVCLLIAQDQLGTLTRQVGASVQPMIVADARDAILLVNTAFAALLGHDHPPLRRLDDLPQLFTEPLVVRRRIDDLQRTGQSWRDEVCLLGEAGVSVPLVVRAEPVLATLDRKLGTILHFDPVADRKAADAARRSFGADMIERRAPRAGRLDLAGNRDYQTALSGVVENAQRAALEITYGLDPEAMPRMLESVRASVERSSDLIEHLIWHASGVDSEG